MVNCCIKSCPSNALYSEISFFRFPQASKQDPQSRKLSLERRNAWLTAVKRSNLNFKNALVCSKHFVSGTPAALQDYESLDWVPSIGIGDGDNPTVNVDPGASNSKMVKEMPSSTVANRDEECLRKSLMEVVKSDSSSVCRLCLSKEQKLTRVFVDESGIDNALLKKIFDCTSVKVKLNDIFPSAICAVCDLKLNDFYKFREKSIENNTILHDLLGEDLSKDVYQSAARTTQPEDEERESQHGDDEDDDDAEDAKAQEQQPATSTTSTPEGQQNEAAVVIALNQLSELGLRSMQDSAAQRSSDGSDMIGITVAKNLHANPSSGEGGNVVSSSWGTVQQRQLQPSTATNRKRSYGLAAMEMTTGTSARAGREGKYECKECRRTFRNAYTLRRHNNLHTRTNLFPCEYCGKNFNDRSNWKIHQRSHTGDNLYTCLVCLKTFISPSTLKYHLRSHRRLESFDCRMCQDSFDSYDLLEEHARAQHQQGCLQDLEEFSTDGDQLIDAARFVKIELEDGELPASRGDISTTNTSKNLGGDDEELDEDIGLPVEGMDLFEPSGLELHGAGTFAEDGEHYQTVGSSSGIGYPVSHAQVAQVVEERRQQLLDQVLQRQMNEGVVSEGMATATATSDEVTIKQETPAEDDVEVKEEPQDDSFEMDPSELLQQAMEEAEADDPDKELSSSSSSPSTVILFRCDYCMKIFHYLDELNVHMLLHNGMQGAGGNSALLFGSSESASGFLPDKTKAPLRPPTVESEEKSSQQNATLKHLNSRSLPAGPAVDGGDCDEVVGSGTKQRLKGSSRAAVAVPLYSVRKGPGAYRFSSGASIVEPEFMKQRRNAFEPDPVDVVNALPPEHTCSKCSKMFRTEELRRVHEATHADDELVNKVRSCRDCNRVFKCELNLLAHMRKHHSFRMLGSPPPSNEPDGGADSAGSGNDESCSSTSMLANNTGTTNQPADLDLSCNDGEMELGDGGGAPSDGETGSSSPGDGQKDASRRCEICAISFSDVAMLEKHLLSHFERNEAVAYVPSADRPFKCTECQKRFKRKDYLLIHIRTHTGERRYKCDLCSSAFVHPSNLITHRKLHSNERPHKCNLCNATFKLFAGLKIHRRRCEQKLPKLTVGSDQGDLYFRWSN